MNVVFFTDRDLGKQFPDSLRAAGCRVERHADHFAPFASDESWLAHVGPRIHAFLKQHEPPFIAKLYRPTPSALAWCSGGERL